MKKESQEKIVSAFPEVYGEPGELVQMFGFDVGDGWSELLHELSCDLNKIAKTATKINLKKSFISVNQVKEKFGLLRVYVSVNADEDSAKKVYAIIDDYEQKSGTICEQCGEPGKLRGGGWYVTLCDKHYQHRQNR